MPIPSLSLSTRQSVSHPPRLLCQMFHAYSLCLSFRPPTLFLFQRLIFYFSSFLSKNTVTQTAGRSLSHFFFFSVWSPFFFFLFFDAYKSHRFSRPQLDVVTTCGRATTILLLLIPGDCRFFLESSSSCLLLLLFLYFEVSIEICQRYFPFCCLGSVFSPSGLAVRQGLAAIIVVEMYNMRERDLFKLGSPLEMLHMYISSLMPGPDFE